MKEDYMTAEIELICFDSDIITSSSCPLETFDGGLGDGGNTGD